MNVWTKILSGLIRVSLEPVTRWLLSKDIISCDDTVKFYADLASFAISVGWTAWAWWKAHRESMTALAMPKGSTPEELHDSLANGTKAPVLTPADVAPKLTT